MHYEATAEISDAEPCASLTLRFLSLQTKSSVHVEEIYIYADPIDESSATQDSSSSTTGYSNTSSLFAMLVPNLLQMSKSGLSSRINERYFSSDRINNAHDVNDQTAKLDASVTEELSKESVNLREEKNSYQLQKESSSYQVEMPVATDNTIPSLVQSHSRASPYQSHASDGSEADIRQTAQEATVNTDPVELGPTSDVEKMVTNESASRVEKILEQLVSKMEKIETYFMKFEEKMVGPISCIESRLERLENQFTLLTNDIQSLRVPLKEPCSHVTDEVERSQDPLSSDESVTHGAAGCQVETKRSSGTTFRAPECLSEDESDDDVHCCNDDTVNDDMEVDTHVPNRRKPISIDGALASALAAFATESTPNVSTVRRDQMKDPDLVNYTDSDSSVLSASCPGGEGVPLVSIDEVQSEAASDLLSSFESRTHTGRDYNEVGEAMTNLDENLHQDDEVGPKEETSKGSDIAAQVKALTDIGHNMNEDLHQVDGDTTSEAGPTERIIEDSEILSHTEPVLFSKSVIGEISDEEEVEPSFTPDSPRFACNSPLSSSDFEPSLLNYGEILRGWGNSSSSSTASSFDESFLKTKTQINLADNINTESSSFSEGSQKVPAFGNEPKMLDPLAVLLDEMSDIHGPVPATAPKENTPSTNDPFFDLEGIPSSSEVGPADSNMPQFESLI
jgi:myosin heavy subunit